MNSNEKRSFDVGYIDSKLLICSLRRKEKKLFKPTGGAVQQKSRTVGDFLKNYFASPGNCLHKMYFAPLNEILRKYYVTI